MAITARAVGAWAASNATTQTVTLPTHQTGDMLIVRTIRKPFTSPDNTVINTAGWTAVATGVANGSTANGNGVGSMGFKAFYKIATSAAETNPVVTWGTTSAPGACVAVSYQKASGEAWVTPVGDGGGDATARTSQTSTIASHVSVKTDDLVDFFRGQCDDSGALTVPTITQTGVTFDTVTEYPATALLDGTSNDIAADGGYRTATAGTSSAAAVVTGTSAASEQHGAWMTRLRVNKEITLDLLDGAPALYAPTITPAPVTIVLGLIDASNALYAPTLSQPIASQTITLDLLDASNALYAPTFTVGAVTLTVPLLDSEPALYAPTISTVNALTIPLLESTPELYAPTIGATNTITLDLLDGANALYAPTITTVNAVELELLDAGNALYAPSITTVATISLELLDAENALYAPTLSQGAQILELPLLDGENALYAPTLDQSVSDTQTITLGTIDSGSELYAPTLELMLQSIELPLLDSGAELYAPTISGGLVLGGHIPAFITINPTQRVILPRLNAGRALYAPTLEVDDDDFVLELLLR